MLVPATAFNTRVHHVFNEQYSIGLIADQSPAVRNMGLNFFNKPTSFTAGPEKGAKRGKTAAVFVRLYKKEWHYRFEPMEFIADAEAWNGGELYDKGTAISWRTPSGCKPENYLWGKCKWKSEYRWIPGRWIDPLPAPTVKWHFRGQFIN